MKPEIVKATASRFVSLLTHIGLLLGERLLAHAATVAHQLRNSSKMASHLFNHLQQSLKPVGTSVPFSCRLAITNFGTADVRRTLSRRRPLETFGDRLEHFRAWRCEPSPRVRRGLRRRVTGPRPRSRTLYGETFGTTPNAADSIFKCSF